MSRFRNVVVAGCVGLMAATAVAGPAAAVPRGALNVRPPIFGTMHGTNCSYNVTIPVDTMSPVTYYEYPKGHPERARVVGRDQTPVGALSSLTWWPKTEGKRRLYAVQDGKKSKIVAIQVTRGYGSGGTCAAW